MPMLASAQAPRLSIHHLEKVQQLGVFIRFFVFVSPTNIETMYNLKMMMSPSSTSQKKKGILCHFSGFIFILEVSLTLLGGGFQ